MRRCTRALATFLATLLGAHAAAAQLVTPVFRANAGESAGCGILNVGNKPITVTIQVRRTNGTEAGSSGPQTIAPYEWLYRSHDGSSNDYLFYCLFLGRFSPKQVRANGEVVSDLAAGTKTKLLIPAH